MTYANFIEILEDFAPTRYAQPWDNVGSLLYTHDEVKKVLVCLDVDEAVLEEAKDSGYDTILTYHPILFNPTKSICKDEHTGSVVIEACKLGLNIYALHTAYDALPCGMCYALGNILGLTEQEPLVVEAYGPQGEAIAVAGTVGVFKEELCLEQLSALLKKRTNTPSVKISGRGKDTIQRIACVCGSGADYLHAAQKNGADALLTGEAKHSDYYEAQAKGLWLVEIGHFDSEQHAVKDICIGLQKQLNRVKYDITIHGSVVGVRPYCVL